MTAFRFGTNFRPDTPERTREWLSRAEGAGFHALGISDSQALFRETWTMLGLMASAVQRVSIGPWVSNPLTRHPTVTASAMATLDDAMPGRVVLGISTGHSAVMNLGLKPATLAYLEEYVLAVRRLLEDGEAEYQGMTCRLPWAKGRRIPIYISAHGPRGLRLGGKIGDGVLAGLGVDQESIAKSLSLIAEGATESGRTLDQLDVWFVSYMEVASSTEEAMASGVKDILSLLHFASWSPTLLETISPQYRENVLRLAQAYDISHHQTTDQDILRRYVSLAESLGVREYLLGRFGVVGTPEECLRKLEEMGKAGCYQVWLNMPGHHYPDYGDYVETLAQKVLSQAAQW